MKFMHATFIATLLIACGDKESNEPSSEPAGEPSVEPSTEVTDVDQDGIPAEEDCDDEDASMPNDDADCDGILTNDDCDDNDPESTAISEDADCDETLTADDCDDNDSESNTVEEDADCDGVLTVDDCDDNDAASTAVADDVDCDGTLTADDCDDTDAASTIISDDADCDGVLTLDDCDDNDANSTTVSTDGDCDGTVTADDCDDNDANSTIVSNDGDCDGTLTSDDCDDSDNASTIIATDGDCDGVLTLDDCDDNDNTSTIISTDADCDGTLTLDDCDDNNANSTIVSNDGDCDGTLTSDDCDDNDSNSTTVATDGDCDGTLTLDDCDDNNANSTIVSNDGDCDGTLTLDDCDDNDANSTTVSTDGDCDGVLTLADCDDNDATSYPGATEIWYNGVDNDCSGNASDYDQDGDGVDSLSHGGLDCNDTDANTLNNTYYMDADGDSWGDPNPSLTMVACTLPAGYADNDQDCNDVVGSGENIHPNATEVCDLIDNDCDSLVDDDDSSLDTSTGTVWYADTDGDSAGDPNSTIMACDMPTNYTDNTDDCDDSDAYTFLGAAILDDPNACMTDFDGDDWGDSTANGNVVSGSDCDDSDAGVSPSVTDDGGSVVDGIDNDCDGVVDEDSYLDISFLLPGDLIITEVMPDPVAVSDTNGEWFEIYNDTNVDLNLNGLGFMDDGSDDFTVVGDLFVPAGAYVVFAKQGDSTINGGVTVDYEYGSGMGLTNTSDEIYIYNATEFIDSIAWDNGATFPNPSGASMSLSPGTSAADNDNGSNWCDGTSTYGAGDLGTPGSANDACPAPLSYATDIAPLLGSCMGCHGGQFLSSYSVLMSSDAGDWRGNNASANMPLITPNDPSLSHLYRKIAGTQTVGGQMFTSSTTVSMVEQWINDGAQP